MAALVTKWMPDGESLVLEVVDAVNGQGTGYFISIFGDPTRWNEIERARRFGSALEIQKFLALLNEEAEIRHHVRNLFSLPERPANKPSKN